MPTSKIEYLGNLRTKCTHLKSGVEIVTDAPVDNNGKGESFSPTDLVATAYVSCMLTIIGIYCESHDIQFDYAVATVNKLMESNPRRIGSLEIEIDFTKNNWDESIQKRVRNAGEKCPVAKTVAEGVEISFVYQF
ncbi:MAG: OsmC family protein [Crocinitomicaceae bacterium]|nr:OsmC family protein [Crocinitomicaceae bacterium]